MSTVQNFWNQTEVGIIGEPSDQGTPGATRLAIGTFVNICGVMLAVKLGTRLFGLSDTPAIVLGLTMALFLLSHALYMRRTYKMKGVRFSPIPLLIAVGAGIGLCVLARILPFLAA
jgi:hypothetical protein